MKCGMCLVRLAMVAVLVLVSAVAKANDCEQSFYSTDAAHFAKPSAFIAKDMKEIIDFEKITDAKERNVRRKAYYFQDLRGPMAISSAIATWSMAIYSAAHIVSNYIHQPKAILFGALAIPPALYVADVFGAFVHKFFDSFAIERMNPIGRAARQFRIHHEYPISLNDASYINHVYGPSQMTLPFFATTAFLAGTGTLDPVVGTAALTFQMTLMHSMEIHRRAHLAKPSYITEVLQKARIFLSRSQHMVHHTGMKDDNYQVVNGWSEPMFQKLRFWERLDNLYWRYMHRMPNNWVQEPASIPDSVYKELMSVPSMISPDMKPMMEAFPKRSSEATQALMDRRDKWEAEYVASRQALYRDLEVKVGYDAANRLWRSEQQTLPGLFGAEVRDLGKEVKDLTREASRP